MPINKFTTLLDLSRQAKIITGETATFDGKIQAGIPFSGYPTGVNVNTAVSLGTVSNQNAIFSGNTGTTLFDLANPLSPNYNAIFSGYTAFTWSNPLFSATTSGLTLPITTLSAETQVLGPYWTLTQTGYTGDYVIGTQYTGYTISYSFFNVSEISSGLFSGVTNAIQENFSAGTLDYKGPLDYLSTKENATVDGRLITNKITITNGASSATTNYVLSQIDPTGKGGWNSLSSLLSGSCLPIVNLETVNDCTSGITFNSDITINGDVVINGSATTINTQIIQSKDNNIILNYSGTHITAIGGGITLEDGVSNGVDSGIYTDSNGIWTIDPTFRVVGANSTLYYDPTSVGGNLYVSGNTGLPRFGLSIAPYLTRPSAGGQVGLRTWDDATYIFYGNVGDMFMYAGNEINGLNIINGPGTNTEDYIRFYAGQYANATADIHIEGTGSTRGYVGMGTETPTEKLHVDGSVRIVDGTEQNGYVFTSDANGVGSWQNVSGLFTGNTSATCISDLYVSNLHSCSPLNVNPNDEGNIYFGSASGITIDILNNKIGLYGSTLNQTRLDASTFGSGGVNNTIKLSLYNTSQLDTATNKIFFDRYWGTPSVPAVVSGDTTAMSLTARAYMFGSMRNLATITMSGEDLTGSTISGNIKFYTRNGGIFSSEQERARITPSGNLGIGETNPAAKLHVGGDVRIDNDVTIGGIYNINTPSLAIGQNSEIGIYNSGVSIPSNLRLDSTPASSRLTLKNGQYLPELRTTFTQYSNYYAIEANISTATTNSPFYLVNESDGLIIFRVNSVEDSMYLLPTGDTTSVFSGTGAPVVYVTNFLEAENIALRAVGSTAFVNDIRIDANGKLTTNTSDERLKENINSLDNPLNILLQLSGITYQWKDRFSGGDDVRFGFLAQQVESVEPRLVFTNKNDGYKGLNNDCFTPLIVESIKEIYNNPQIPNYTPTSSLDSYGNVGNITMDDDYFYIKTNNGWKRSSLQSF